METCCLFVKKKIPFPCSGSRQKHVPQGSQEGPQQTCFLQGHCCSLLLNAAHFPKALTDSSWVHFSKALPTSGATQALHSSSQGFSFWVQNLQSRCEAALPWASKGSGKACAEARLTAQVSTHTLITGLAGEALGAVAVSRTQAKKAAPLGGGPERGAGGLGAGCWCPRALSVARGNRAEGTHSCFLREFSKG